MKNYENPSTKVIAKKISGTFLCGHGVSLTSIPRLHAQILTLTF